MNVEELSEKKILIVHQQVLANTLREEFISANINVASWFMMNKEQKKEQDILFKEEDDWITSVSYTHLRAHMTGSLTSKKMNMTLLSPIRY